MVCHYHWHSVSSIPRAWCQCFLSGFQSRSPNLLQNKCFFISPGYKKPTQISSPVIKPIQPRTYSSKSQSLGIWYAFLTHPGMTRSVVQILVFIRRLYVQITLYSSIIFYLNIQVIKVSATLKIAIFSYLRFQRFQIDMLESFLQKKNQKILFLSKDIGGKRFFLINYLN